MSKETPKLWKCQFLEGRLNESLEAPREAQRLTSKNGAVPKRIATGVGALISKTEGLHKILESWPQRSIP